MSETSDPAQTWSGEFGEEWTERNSDSVADVNARYRERYGIALLDLMDLFLTDVDRDARILEVGTNTSVQLRVLQKLGFENLYRVDVLDHAVERAQTLSPDLEIFHGEASSLPFDTDSFDPVFTRGVLIHIPQEHIETVTQELARCASEYVLGFEYHADEYTRIDYRTSDEILWKADFSAQCRRYTDLELSQEILISYLDEDVHDTMFLLETPD
jgi:pseudaminic acid biosynthesis-associated methylase